jgi:hypothetical protein
VLIWLFAVSLEEVVLTEAMESMEHRKSRDDSSFMLDGWRRELV